MCVTLTRGGVLPLCMHIGYNYARPHFQPWISVLEHIIFTNYQKIRSGASPFYSFGGFCRSGDHHFQNFFISTIYRLPRPAQPDAKRSAAPRVSSRPERQPDASWQFRRLAFSRSKRIKLVPEPRIFKLKTAQARSGAPHFYARPGARSRAGPIFHFAAAHTYQNFGRVPPPPPLPGVNPACQWQHLEYLFQLLSWSWEDHIFIHVQVGENSQ